MGVRLSFLDGCCIVMRVLCGLLQDSLFLHDGEQGTGARYWVLGLLLSTSAPAFGFSSDLVTSEFPSSVAGHEGVDVPRCRHYGDDGGISFVDRVGSTVAFPCQQLFHQIDVGFFQGGM